MVPDHGEGFGRQEGLIFADVVEILVVAPREHHVVEAAARGVDAVLGAVNLVTYDFTAQRVLVVVTNRKSVIRIRFF